jgi:hypothetical protein
MGFSRALLGRARRASLRAALPARALASIRRSPVLSFAPMEFAGIDANNHISTAPFAYDAAGRLLGCDLHARYQQIAMTDEVTGELTERRLG